MMGTKVLPISHNNPPKPGFGTDGSFSPLSLAYKLTDNPHCLKLEVQLMTFALYLARASAGSSMAARMAMMAMTTNNSIKVNPSPVFLIGFFMPEPFIRSKGGRTPEFCHPNYHQPSITVKTPGRRLDPPLHL